MIRLLLAHQLNQQLTVIHPIKRPAVAWNGRTVPLPLPSPRSGFSCFRREPIRPTFRLAFARTACPLGSLSLRLHFTMTPLPCQRRLCMRPRIVALGLPARKPVFLKCQGLKRIPIAVAGNSGKRHFACGVLTARLEQDESSPNVMLLSILVLLPFLTQSQFFNTPLAATTTTAQK
jgi:hypothetical protein